MARIRLAGVFAASVEPVRNVEPQSADTSVQSRQRFVKQGLSIALSLLPVLAAPAHAEQGASLTIEALEARIKVLEAGASATPGGASASAPAAREGNAFNPAISLILNGRYAHHSLHPDNYLRSGFPLVGEGGPGEQGLSLGESELMMSANVDDKFYGQVTLAVGSEDGETELGLEEAYIDTTALPAGFTLRLGRFFSNIGYLNTHHAHTDKFSDRPLAYQALLGNHYGDDGVQLRWLAPTDLFLEISTEVLRGQNFPAGGPARNGAGVKTLSAHVGGDVGTESSWLTGVSLLRANTVESEDGFSGRNSLYIADLTWKWAPQGNFKDGGLTVRSEYLVDDRDGDFSDPALVLPDQVWVGKRRGAYVEGIYRLNRQWETGYRFDRLWADDSGPYASTFDPDRHSVMLTWLNSEFSLVRLQYSHDRPNAIDTDRTVSLQYQVSLGAHGAHKF